jgi:hypothetical protein
MRARVRFVSRLVAFALPVLLAAAAPVEAQSANVASATTGFAELQQALEPGDTLILTLEDGQKTRGKLVEARPDQLLLAQGGSQRPVGLGDIQKVQRTRFGVTVGTAIGLAAGLGLGTLAASHGGNEGISAGGAFALLLALSTGVGLGIDAAINLPRTVYERERTVAVAPIVRPHAMGVSVRMAF